MRRLFDAVVLSVVLANAYEALVLLVRYVSSRLALGRERLSELPRLVVGADF